MPVIQVKNNQIRYRHQASEEPTAPVVLLMHMAGSSSVAWSSVIRRFGKGVQVYCPDLPGHGQSQGALLESIEQMADFAYLFLDALGVQRAFVGGHSMGGAIALQMALQHPNRVTGLLLVGTSARLGVSPMLFQVIENSFESLPALFAGMATGRSSSLPAHGEPIFPQTTQEGVLKDFRACAAFDVSTRLAEVGCPAVVLVGGDDQLTPRRWGERLANGLPAAKFLVEEGCGHLLPRERPKLVVEEAQRLLDAISH